MSENQINNPIHILYDMRGSPNDNHPQEVMKQLGITYQYAVPQSMFDSWWFFNCENTPSPLPAYMQPLRIKLWKAIGHGLNKKMVREIKGYPNANR